MLVNISHKLSLCHIFLFSDQLIPGLNLFIMKFSLIFVFFLLLVGHAAAEPVQSDYLVGDGDVLKISVYDNPDLDAHIRINRDGSIQFPLIGRVDLSGLTVAQSAAKIEGLLADGYLINPQVSLFIEEYGSKKVVIMGWVKTPGIYELTGLTNLLELISKAGGLREDAGQKITINRTLPGEDHQEQFLTIDLRKLLETGDPSLNIRIMDQDRIFIAKAEMIYVIGEVMKPGAYKYADGETVIKAISMAGDFDLFAAKKKIRITRRVDGKEQIIEKVPLHQSVLPGDIIEVPESLF